MIHVPQVGHAASLCHCYRVIRLVMSLLVDSGGVDRQYMVLAGLGHFRGIV